MFNLAKPENVYSLKHCDYREWPWNRRHPCLDLVILLQIAGQCIQIRRGRRPYALGVGGVINHENSWPATSRSCSVGEHKWLPMSPYWSRAWSPCLTHYSWWHWPWGSVRRREINIIWPYKECEFCVHHYRYFCGHLHF